jgi:DNA mismatch endonuclease (patch repair protein)
MSAIHSKNTRPEIILRKVLWSKGLKYRIHYGKEMIDIAFPAERLAIFVDGCFWHGCPVHSHLPESNKEYWLPKLKKNIERDAAKSEQLKIEGWHVMRIWEHELSDTGVILRKIQNALEAKNNQRAQ